MNPSTKGTIMQIRRSILVPVIAAVAALTLGGIQLATAQVKKGKTRALKTSQLMKGIVKPHCEAVKKGIDAGPADDKAWEELALHASLLNEASFTLMEDGRCPDGDWANAATKSLRTGSASLLSAIEMKDTAGAKAAFGAMTKSCKECHDKHKKKE
jgi:cytochrome c556